MTRPPAGSEVKGPPGERHFLRYVHGVLTDAWTVSTAKLDPSALVDDAKPTWTGTVLGPAEDGFLAYGTASSWTLADRTVLYWRDRLGKLDVIASRAIPPPQYGVGHPSPLAMPGDTHAQARLSGDFRKEAHAYAGPIASCFDTSPKPVGATIQLKLDARGQPSRIKVVADQPAFNLEDCVAAALMNMKGAPNQSGTLALLRFH